MTMVKRVCLHSLFTLCLSNLFFTDAPSSATHRPQWSGESYSDSEHISADTPGITAVHPGPVGYGGSPEVALETHDQGDFKGLEWTTLAARDAAYRQLVYDNHASSGRDTGPSSSGRGARRRADDVTVDLSNLHRLLHPIPSQHANQKSFLPASLQPRDALRPLGTRVRRLCAALGVPVSLFSRSSNHLP
jgi:hypothetical protein